MATTELAVLFPILLAIVVGIFQTALWAHAGAVAQAAADHGAEAAARFGSDDAAGVAAAFDFIDSAGTISDPIVISVNAPDSELVTVQVTGSYPSLFGSFTITATATTVRERITS